MTNAMTEAAPLSICRVMGIFQSISFLMIALTELEKTVPANPKDAYHQEELSFERRGENQNNLRKLISDEQRDKNMEKIIGVLEEKDGLAAPFYGTYHTEMYRHYDEEIKVFLNTSFELLKWCSILYLYFNVFPYMFGGA
jgi:hypothetical protein